MGTIAHKSVREEAGSEYLRGVFPFGEGRTVSLLDVDRIMADL
jgi:chemotaxis signal transduction protein